MRAAILGCGPAGLMAAHGAVIGGADEIRIFSKKRKSELFGAQYLHAPIPQATKSDHFKVNYRLLGTPEEYRAKVYGNDWRGTVSPEELEDSHDGWDIRETYDWLWHQYARYIYDIDLNPLTISKVRDQEPDIIFNSVPRPALCTKGHQFAGTKIWAAGDAPERGKLIPYQQCPSNTVWCNGGDQVAWYRLSNIDGFRTVEWPQYVHPPISAAEVVKPTFTNCDCNSDMTHVGRYGLWEKGTLSHHAFQAALVTTQAKVAVS